MRILIATVALLITLQTARAGTVREIVMDSAKMQTIYLRLGRSTVLHFSEKPEKVVVGNQNFFGIEFTGSDVTLQPLSPVTSNLFVYGKFHRYGFILTARQTGSYDDLVNVRWRRSQTVSLSGFGGPDHREGGKAKSKPQKSQKTKNPLPFLKIRGLARIALTKVLVDEVRDLIVVDMDLETLSKRQVAVTRQSIRVTQKGGAVFLKDIVVEKWREGRDGDSRPWIHIRLFLRAEKRSRDISLLFSLHGKRGEIKIPRRML